MEDGGSIDAGYVDGGGIDGGPLDAGVDAGPDTTPPVVTVTAMAPPPRPNVYWLRRWKLDEFPAVAVEWVAPDVDPASATLSVVGFDGGVRRSTGCVSDAGFACFEIDAWSIAQQSRAHHCEDFICYFGLEASVADRSGNTGRALGQLQLERRLWMRHFFTLDNAPAPAIDPDGNVYVGSQEGLNAITSEGDDRWSVDGGRIRSHPIVVTFDGEHFVAWAEDGSGSPRLRLHRSDGGDVFSCTAPFVGTSQGPPVYLETTGRRIIAANVVDASPDGGGPVVVAMGFARSSVGAFACHYATAPGALPFFQAPVAVGSHFCFPTVEGEVACSALSDAGLWPSSFSVISPDAGLIITALAVDRRQALWAAAGRRFPVADVQLLRIDVSSATVTQRFIADPWQTARVPRLLLLASGDAGETGYLFSETQPVGMFDPVAGSLTGSLNSRTDPETHPAFLTVGGKLYAVYSGYMQVYPQHTLMAAPEFPPLGYSVDDNGFSPNLDCNRRTGKGGTLYVRQAHFTAMLIDHGGVDVSAHWPRYQRDPGNTGNGTLDTLSRYACPP